MRKLLFGTLVAVLTLSSFGVKVSQAEAPLQPEKVEFIEIKDEIDTTSFHHLHEQLHYWAEYYNVSPTLMEAIIKCESGWNTKALGDSGRAYGLAQFWLGTFLAFEKESRLNLEYKSPEDQIRLLAWALSHNKQSHWTCYHIVIK